jgi:hypothetical protein
LYLYFPARLVFSTLDWGHQDMIQEYEHIQNTKPSVGDFPFYIKNVDVCKVHKGQINYRKGPKTYYK